MHELALVRNLVRTCLARAEGRSVQRLVLDVGKLSGVVPDALRFAFEAVQAQTPALAEAVLEIREPTGRARCRRCARELALETPWDACPCGSVELDWLAGQALELVSMEVARV